MPSNDQPADPSVVWVRKGTNIVGRGDVIGSIRVSADAVRNSGIVVGVSVANVKGSGDVIYSKRIKKVRAAIADLKRAIKKNPLPAAISAEADLLVNDIGLLIDELRAYRRETASIRTDAGLEIRRLRTLLSDADLMDDSSELSGPLKVLMRFANSVEGTSR